MPSSNPGARDSQSEIRSLLSAIQANPSELSAYCALARAYASAGESKQAELTLLRSIGIDPFYGDAWLELGTLFSNLGDWDKAANAFEHARALEPDSLRAWVWYAMALLATQDIRQAVEARDILLQRFSASAESYLIAGHVNKVRGEVREATDNYRRAIEIDPLQTEAIFNFVDVCPPTTSDAFTKRIETLKRDATLSPRQRANICFALARIYERAGEVAQAFATYQEANSALDAMMQALGAAYDRRKLEEDTGRIIDLFSAGVMATPLEPLELDLKMIFVVGLPRSGTTLVEKILGDHPGVSVGGELPFMQECLAALMASGDASGTQGKIRIGDDNNRRLLARLRERYLDGLFERDLDGEFVTDKLPANFRAIGLIRLLFPDARIVHCIREPIATCWSLYTAHLGTHLPYYTSLERLAHYYNSVYSRLMSHWRRTMPGQIIDVRYENVVRMPEETIGTLLEACGLPRTSGASTAAEARQPIYTASMIQARQPIYSTSVSRWEPYAQYLAPLVQLLQAEGSS